jgi:hypothetical protein
MGMEADFCVLFTLANTQDISLVLSVRKIDADSTCTDGRFLYQLGIGDSPIKRSDPASTRSHILSSSPYLAPSLTIKKGLKYVHQWKIPFLGSACLCKLTFSGIFIFISCTNQFIRVFIQLRVLFYCLEE